MFGMQIQILNRNIFIQCKCGILPHEYFFLQHKYKIKQYKCALYHIKIFFEFRNVPHAIGFHVNYKCH